ncbi:thiamine-binding protein [Tepidiforma sp.]|uniref:thiamine-binding protein n=1 Tax=Tepidiforma sp. TaxID=2682230 RepID=UPI002ADD5A5D|nr:thiamine-binding protein [Tepidiforma sp.]
MIVEIECLPRPSGEPGAPYSYVEAAIAVIQASGLNYEVSALGTTFEGEPDEVWRVARAAHEACLAAGAESVLTFVKFSQSRLPNPPTMASLTAKFRDNDR